MKTCIKCERELPLTEFYKPPNRNHLGECRECMNLRGRVNASKYRKKKRKEKANRGEVPPIAVEKYCKGCYYYGDKVRTGSWDIVECYKNCIKED